MADTRITKEQLRSRLQRTASRLWGYNDTVSESNFDPIVGLIFSALAAELEQAYDEVQLSQSRVMERLAQMLLPDVVTSPQPAHTLLHALPIEARTVLKRHQHFHYKKQLQTIAASGKENQKDIFFTPAKDVVLLQGAVKFLATPYQVFRCLNALDKELMCQGETSTENDSLQLWIGLELDSALKDLRGLSLYFNNKNEAEKQRFYALMEMCVVTLGHELLDLKAGFFELRNTAQSRLQAMSDITTKLENRVMSLYAPYFLHVSDSVEISEDKKEVFPVELENYYSSTKRSAFKEKLLWLKVSYPAVLTNKMMSDIQVSMNCFPVINRQLKEVAYRLQDNLNIIPLSADDIYLDLIKIYSSGQFQYNQKNEIGQEQLLAGSYTVRQGSVGRFDMRNANEMLTYMIDLLRDESAAFTAMSNDMLHNNLRQLNQLIQSLQQRLKMDDKRKNTASFLMIQPQKGQENIFIEFWVTQGSYASNLRAGTAMQSYSGSSLKAGTIYSVRMSAAAKEKLSASESIYAFKSALLSRNKIVTEQDIRYACFADLGNLIERVNVRHSFIKPQEKEQGFQKVILVELFAAPTKNVQVDWDYACRQLQLKLEQESMGIVPIRVVKAA